jgi:hypothetical protein
MTATISSERVRAYRARQRIAGLPDVTRLDRKRHKIFRSVKRLFVGCDGEGCGTDEFGRQLYMLFRMGERELFTGKPLSTWELLDFICDHPAGDLLVGFAFGYDVTMILRDLPEGQQRRLFEPKTFGEGHSPYVWFREFDIDYLPKQYIRVRRVQIEKGNNYERRIPVKGSARTIYETFGFFHKSFVRTINEFDIGTTEQRQSILANKNRRGKFTSIGDAERTYCALECEYLAALMERLREYCHAAGINPQTWNGAGKLAAALHKQHKTLKRKDLSLFVPPKLEAFANMAYYGGRFEITRTGAINEKVYEYDIGSAYPDAMRFLPCLMHGRWEFVNRIKSGQHSLYVSACQWRFDYATSSASLGPFPVRSKGGHLYWPAEGNGIYWSPEIETAEKLGFEVTLKNGWIYHRECDCRQFDWIEPLYEYRRSIGSHGPGYPIKLGSNSLYGKLAQRKGNGSYNNMVWAGLITAFTRAKLNRAIALAPDRIVMLATDGVYSLDPLPDLDLGEKLGQWQMSELNGLFIVQPGLYWCPEKRKKKSRGLSGKFFEEKGLTERFENDWLYFRDQQCRSQIEAPFPSVPVPVPAFIGLKLALSRNKPKLAGCWTNDTRIISFDYRNKRQGHEWNGNHIVTGIKPGGPGVVSLPHRDFLAAGGQEPWEEARLVLDEQPDYIDFSIPFED